MMNRYRPVLRIPRTQLETLLEGLTVLGIIALLAMTVWGYTTLPAIIPTHYGISGAPNAYGSKESLLLPPILAICIAVLLSFLTRYPHLLNYAWAITPENAPRQYYLARLLLRWLTFEMVLMFCGLELLIIQSAQNYATGPFVLIIPAFVVLLFVTIILYILTAARARWGYSYP